MYCKARDVQISGAVVGIGCENACTNSYSGTSVIDDRQLGFILCVFWYGLNFFKSVKDESKRFKFVIGFTILKQKIPTFFSLLS